VHIGHDESLAHLLQGGIDALLVPSRFEPCGLTQLCALRYGAIPVVSRVGGLADTVIDANEMALAADSGTGIVFSPVTAGALRFAIERTVAVWEQRPKWRAMQHRGMATDVSWRRPATRYAALYHALLAQRTA
jgi:starch synthase